MLGPNEGSVLQIFHRLPKFSLIDQNGEEVAWHHLYGRVWLANFVYTRCDGACPAQTDQMNLLQGMPKYTQNWANIRLVSIRVDPEQNDPQALSIYIRDRELDTSQWLFLTGARSAVTDLIQDGF